MSKKILSTVLLFTVFIGFLWWGLSLLLHPDPTENPQENVIFAVLLLGCSAYAFISILLLPRKKQP